MELGPFWQVLINLIYDLVLLITDSLLIGGIMQYAYKKMIINLEKDMKYTNL